MERLRHEGLLGSFEMCIRQPERTSRLDGRERVFPDVTIELVSQLDYRYRPVIHGRAGDPFPFFCVEGLRRGPSTADAAWSSPARLAGHFKTHVGMTPKRFARLARFRRTLDALVSSESLADVVYEMNYYDHAHLDADFREHAGLSPTAFREASR